MAKLLDVIDDMAATAEDSGLPLIMIGGEVVRDRFDYEHERHHPSYIERDDAHGLSFKFGLNSDFIASRLKHNPKAKLERYESGYSRQVAYGAYASILYQQKYKMEYWQNPKLTTEGKKRLALFSAAAFITTSTVGKLVAGTAATALGLGAGAALAIIAGTIITKRIAATFAVKRKAVLDKHNNELESFSRKAKDATAHQAPRECYLNGPEREHLLDADPVIARKARAHLVTQIEKVRPRYQEWKLARA